VPDQQRDLPLSPKRGIDLKGLAEPALPSEGRQEFKQAVSKSKTRSTQKNGSQIRFLQVTLNPLIVRRSPMVHSLG